MLRANKTQSIPIQFNGYMPLMNNWLYYRWMENDMKLPDITDGFRFSIVKDLHTGRRESMLYIGEINSKSIQLLVVLEVYEYCKVRRSLIDIITLVKVLANHEREHYAGSVLLDVFHFLKNPRTLVKEFKKGGESAYCFLLKVEEPKNIRT